MTDKFPEEVGHVDRIFHLACPASPKRFPEAPLGILNTCFEGTRNVLELAAKTGARVLLASTSGMLNLHTYSIMSFITPTVGG